MTSRVFLAPFAKLLIKFARSESGLTLPLLALSLVMITTTVGMSIDIARAQLVQSKLQFSLDAAGLAAGSTVSTAALNTEVAKYLNANFNNYLGSTVTGTGITVDSTNTIITLSATATLPSTFMNVVGVQLMTVHANSQISRAVTGLELVMVLDNTGSMSQSAGGSVSKIAALQSAANTLVSTLFQGQATAPPNLYIGIVPFSQAVNIGLSHMTWMNTTYDNGISGMPASQGPGWGPTSWFGCVDARQNGYDVTDDPPSVNTTATLFNQYYWPSDALNYGSPFNNTPNNDTNPWATVKTYNKCRAGVCSTVTSCTASGTTTCTPLTYSYLSPLNTTSRGPNYLCPQQVTPMTTSAATLTSAINAMTAQGDTLINEGMVWGWRMLSPRWQGLWGGTMNANNLPLPYGTRGMNKAIVLVTDGENTIDNSSHGAEWFLENDRTGSTNGSTAVSNLDSKTLQICTAMKNEGIYIYTIGVGTNGGINTAELQSCATASNYAFLSPTTSQLASIFSAIGDSLSNLRVSK